MAVYITPAAALYSAQPSQLGYCCKWISLFHPNNLSEVANTTNISKKVQYIKLASQVSD